MMNIAVPIRMAAILLIALRVFGCTQITATITPTFEMPCPFTNLIYENRKFGYT